MHAARHNPATRLLPRNEVVEIHVVGATVRIIYFDYLLYGKAEQSSEITRTVVLGSATLRFVSHMCGNVLHLEVERL